jgi:hypothetical protein
MVLLPPSAFQYKFNDQLVVSLGRHCSLLTPMYKYPNSDPTTKGFEKYEQRGTDLKRQPQVSGRQVKYIVRAWTEKVSVDANDECYRERKSNQASGQSGESLRKRDESGHRNQVDQNQ